MFRTRDHLQKANRPTRNDVAREANISGSTVSRVLSGRTDVPISEETRIRVLKAAADLGYRPNPNARALMTRRSGLIGFWMSLEYSRFRSQVMDRMRVVLSSTELAMAVTDIDEEFHLSHSFARALRVPVEGIIAFDASDSIDAFGRECDRVAPDLPFVSMGVYWTEAKSYVGIDLKAGGREAMDHLLGSGRRKIAYIAPYNSKLLNEGVRYESYAEKMADAGLETDCISVLSVNTVDVQQALEERFAQGNPPEALLCMNDDLALSASSAFSRMGVRIGSDVGIVGFDGIEETGHCPCPITTVRQPIEEMCTLAFQFLRRQMYDSPAYLDQRILKPTLIIRESTQA